MKRISFETAKAVAHIYKEYTTQAYSSTGELVEPYYGGRYHNFEDDNGDCVYAAPYQVELQEWLLKVNIFVSVRMLARDNSGYFFWELFVDNTQIQYSGVELHKTYEEALEAGLYKALKQLI